MSFLDEVNEKLEPDHMKLLAGPNEGFLWPVYSKGQIGPERHLIFECNDPETIKELCVKPEWKGKPLIVAWEFPITPLMMRPSVDGVVKLIREAMADVRAKGPEALVTPQEAPCTTKTSPPKRTTPTPKTTRSTSASTTSRARSTRSSTAKTSLTMPPSWA